jgi:hypothetical protein
VASRGREGTGHASGPGHPVLPHATRLTSPRTIAGVRVVRIGPAWMSSRSSILQPHLL